MRFLSIAGKFKEALINSEPLSWRDLLSCRTANFIVEWGKQRWVHWRVTGMKTAQGSVPMAESLGFLWRFIVFWMEAVCFEEHDGVWCSRPGKRKL